MQNQKIHMEMQGTQHSQNNLKKEQNGGTHFSILKFTTKHNQDSIKWYINQQNSIASPKVNLYICGPLILMGCWENSMGKVIWLFF